jgi:hypothetical protein
MRFDFIFFLEFSLMGPPRWFARSKTNHGTSLRIILGCWRAFQESILSLVYKVKPNPNQSMSMTIISLGGLETFVEYTPQLMLVDPGLKLKLLRIDVRRRPPISVATGMVNLVSYRTAHTNFFLLPPSRHLGPGASFPFWEFNCRRTYHRPSSFATGLSNAIKSTDQSQLSHLEYRLVNPVHVSFCALIRQQLCRR